jgi:hypothetical protein
VLQHVVGGDQRRLEHGRQVVGLEHGLSRPRCRDDRVDATHVAEADAMADRHAVQPQADRSQTDVGGVDPQGDRYVLDDRGSEARQDRHRLVEGVEDVGSASGGFQGFGDDPDPQA